MAHAFNNVLSPISEVTEQSEPRMPTSSPTRSISDPDKTYRLPLEQSDSSSRWPRRSTEAVVGNSAVADGIGTGTVPIPRANLLQGSNASLMPPPSGSSLRDSTAQFQASPGNLSNAIGFVKSCNAELERQIALTRSNIQHYHRTSDELFRTMSAKRVAEHCSDKLQTMLYTPEDRVELAEARKASAQAHAEFVRSEIDAEVRDLLRLIRECP
ncbi:hypothetical protein OIO90_002473 [Microbotryomycetes sp. JL221]|nr:hypothetical protein OIO90_002473 [Microbotryomycetes sp. JL221]